MLIMASSSFGGLRTSAMLKHDSGLNLDGAYKEYRVAQLLKDRIIHVGCLLELSVGFQEAMQKLQ